MAVRVNGKELVEQNTMGDGIANFLGFRAHPDNEGSLVNGIGRMYMKDRCRKDDGTFIDKASDQDIEIDLANIINETWSNGITTIQILEALREIADQARSGVYPNLYGQGWT